MSRFRDTSCADLQKLRVEYERKWEAARRRCDFADACLYSKLASQAEAEINRRKATK